MSSPSSARETCEENRRSSMFSERTVELCCARGRSECAVQDLERAALCEKTSELCCARGTLVLCGRMTCDERARKECVRHKAELSETTVSPQVDAVGDMVAKLRAPLLAYKTQATPVIFSLARICSTPLWRLSTPTSRQNNPEELRTPHLFASPIHRHLVESHRPSADPSRRMEI